MTAAVGSLQFGATYELGTLQQPFKAPGSQAGPAPLLPGYALMKKAVQGHLQPLYGSESLSDGHCHHINLIPFAIPAFRKPVASCPSLPLDGKMRVKHCGIQEVSDLYVYTINMWQKSFL